MKEDQMMTTVKNTEVLYQNYNAVAPLGLICMNGTQELGAKINGYLERWADRNGMPHDDYMIECQCPRFQSGDAKGLIKSTVRGKDLFILVDVGNYSCKYQLFDQENCMSPDDHYMDLMRIIQAASRTVSTSSCRCFTADVSTEEATASPWTALLLSRRCREWAYPTSLQLTPTIPGSATRCRSWALTT